LSSRK